MNYCDCSDNVKVTAEVTVELTLDQGNYLIPVVLNPLSLFVILTQRCYINYPILVSLITDKRSEKLPWC